MAQKRGYDVLRFIEHGKGSYISTTYVEGVTLFQWISKTPKMKKSDCIRMIRELARQLELLHKSKGSPVYQYVNPYCIVLSEDKNIFLIDMKAESNSERLRKMQSRKIRERFLPVKDPFYQNSDIQTDLFGFGRTLQYTMAAVELSDPLTRKEERQIKNIINRCLGKNPKKIYDSFVALRKHLPAVREEKEEREEEAACGSLRWKRSVLLFASLILIVLAGIWGHEYMKNSRAVSGRDVAFSASETLAGDTILSNVETGESLQLEVSESLERKMDSEGLKEDEKKTEYLSEEEENCPADDAETFEKLSKAQSLETLGRYLEAADLYEEILISLDNIQEKEHLYEKTANIYMELGNYDKAYEVLQFGMSELLPSDYLWTCFLDLLTNNDSITDEQKIKYVDEFMKNNSEYENKKYQKLLQERDFYQSAKESDEK